MSFSSDLFSVFQDDSSFPAEPLTETQPPPKPFSERFQLKRKSQQNDESAPVTKKPKLSDKPLILEVAEGTAAAEARKKELMEEGTQTTTIDCIHEVAYPPNWGS